MRGRQQQLQFYQPNQMIDNNNNKREHLSIIIYIFYFDDDCVRVIIYCTRSAVFSTRMIELVQISFRAERVFVVVYSIYSSSAIFGSY